VIEMMNHVESSPYRRLPLGARARRILSAFDSPVSGEDDDALLYMTVGMARVRLLQQMTRSIRRRLRLAEPERLPRGMHFDLVTGDFGSGKSHLAHMLKCDLVSEEGHLVVGHVQITGEASFPATLGKLLRSLRISRTTSRIGGDLETSIWRVIHQWCGARDDLLEAEHAACLGNLPPVVAADFARAVADAARPAPDPAAMQSFVERWIQRADNKQALEVFESILRLFRRLQLGRVVLLVDEFEAVQATDAQSRIEYLQSLQDLHDDFATRDRDLPAVHLTCFSTADWAEMSANILPSLMQPGQRIQQIRPIPDVEDLDIHSLFYRYIGLVQLMRPDLDPPTLREIEAAAGRVIERISGSRHQMRLIHRCVREEIEGGRLFRSPRSRRDAERDD